MHFLNIVHEAVEIGSHIGGAIGNGCNTINDLGYVVADIEHHNYLGAAVEGAETIIHGAETIADVSSGNWF
jgi:hypothetical protein